MHISRLDIFVLCMYLSNIYIAAYWRDCKSFTNINSFLNVYRIHQGKNWTLSLKSWYRKKKENIIRSKIQRKNANYMLTTGISFYSILLLQNISCTEHFVASLRVFLWGKESHACRAQLTTVPHLPQGTLTSMINFPHCWDLKEKKLPTFI